MNKSLLRIIKIFAGVSVILILSVSTFLAFKAKNIYDEVWSKESFSPMKWDEFSKDFKIVAESELDQRNISILFARETMSKYNKNRKVNQLDNHVLGFIVYIYSRLFVSNEKAFSRILANAYLGSGIYGFSYASNYYLGKSIKEVSLSDSALLFAVWTAPGRYNPFLNLTFAYEGRNRILLELADRDKSLESRVRQAINAPISVSSKKPEVK